MREALSSAQTVKTETMREAFCSKIVEEFAEGKHEEQTRSA
jgi:hypothetical protein